tara:strand:- start:288 stop:2384 length:2097 start_codon:yes stop_codon:yes gene_type:complete
MDWSSLFGMGRKPAYQNVVQTTKLDPTIQPFVQKALDEAEGIFDTEMTAGYQPYQGQTIADFTPEQMRAMEGLAGLVGTGKPLQDEALALARGQKEKFTGDIAQQYMSPYQQAVTDIEKREAAKDFESMIMPQFEKQAISAGGMSGLGSRAGVQASLLGQAQMQKLGDIQTKGLQSAYQDASAQFAAQKARERGLSSDLMAAAPAILQQQMKEYGALAGVGEQKQQMGQTALDEAYFREMEKRNFPQDKLAEYTGFVYGNPLMQQKTRTTSTPYRGPGFAQQMMGLAGSAMNIYGMGGGFSPGGFSPQNLYGPQANRKGGGGLMDLPVVRRQASGSLGDDITTMTIPKLKIGDTIIDPSETGLESAADYRKREEAVAAERAKAIATETARREAQQQKKYADMRQRYQEAYDRERELIPQNRGAFFGGFGRGAMNVAGQENRPIGLVEALISGLQGGTASAMEERDKRLKLIRDIEKRESASDIDMLGKETDSMENIKQKLTYAEKINAINADAKLKKALAELPGRVRDKIIKSSGNILEMVKNYAKARDDLGLTGTGKKVKPAVFNAIGKVFERMTKMGLVDGVTRADGSFQVTRIKGNTITPEDTNKLNALYNKAIQTGDVRKASALMQKGLEALGSDIDNKNKKQKRRGNTRTVPGDFFGRVSGVKKDAIIKSNKTGKTYKVIDILPNGELKIQQQ